MSGCLSKRMQANIYKSKMKGGYKVLAKLSAPFRDLTQQPQGHSSGGNCDLYSTLEASGFNVEQVVQHPIAAYMSIKCLLKHKKDLRSVDIHYPSHLNEIDENDLKGAALSIVRLQETYNLSVDDLYCGRVLHFSSNMTLTADDCLLIAQEAFNYLKVDSVDPWLNLCRQHTSHDNLRHHGMINKLEMSNLWMKKILEKRHHEETSETILKLFPTVNSNAVALLKELYEVINFTLSEPEELSEIKRRLHHNTRLLCQGLRDESPLRESTCIVKKHHHSWAPYLVENIYKDPKIMIYHNVLNTKEINIIKRLASEKLMASKTHRFSDGEINISSSRVGKMAWLSPNSSYTLKKVYRRIQQITGLSTETAEELQVQNYGIGGHYEVHMDFIDAHAKQLNIPTGDRIATFLIYMNNVSHGGATAFPQLGIAIQPQEGSALMWYNLKHNGLGDYRTLHAACPIITGTKWVANVWLHEHGQEFIRPCQIER